MLGLDAATDLSKFGYAVAEFSGDAIDLIDCATLGTHDRIEERLAVPLRAAERALIAVDAPLGWPAAMGTVLASHRAGQGLPAEPNSLFRRATDRFVRKSTGKQSLDVGADRIARTAWSALAVLERLRKLTGEALPLVWNPAFSERVGVIEVYPAATLKAWKVLASRYKKSEQQAARLEIANAFSTRAPWLAGLVTGSVDAFDAGICLVAAMDFLDGASPGPIDPELAQREGWIWVKPGSA